MAKYVIKNNLPFGIIIPNCSVKSSNLAIRRFTTIARILKEEGYGVRLVYRDEKDKPLRGTIKVEIDGFYYYVEIYKEG